MNRSGYGLPIRVCHIDIVRCPYCGERRLRLVETFSEIAQPTMNDCCDFPVRFLTTGRTPLAGMTASAMKLTQKNACAIVTDKLVVSVSQRKEPKHVRQTTAKHKIYRALRAVGAIQFP